MRNLRAVRTLHARGDTMKTRKTAAALFAAAR